MKKLLTLVALVLALTCAFASCDQALGNGSVTEEQIIDGKTPKALYGESVNKYKNHKNDRVPYSVNLVLTSSEDLNGSVTVDLVYDGESFSYTVTEATGDGTSTEEIIFHGGKMFYKDKTGGKHAYYAERDGVSGYVEENTVVKALEAALPHDLPESWFKDLAFIPNGENGYKVEINIDENKSKEHSKYSDFFKSGATCKIYFNDSGILDIIELNGVDVNGELSNVVVSFSWQLEHHIDAPGDKDDYSHKGKFDPHKGHRPGGDYRDEENDNVDDGNNNGGENENDPEDNVEPHTHTPAAPVVENENKATCTQDGNYDEVVYCSDESCKAQISRETKTSSALGHDYKIIESVAETCTEDGYLRFECQRGCGLTKEQKLLAPGHIFGDDNVCDECGHTTAPDHTHNYTATVVAPACTEIGYTLHECDCGDKYHSDYIDQNGHRWDDGIVEKAKTCTENGVMLYSCVNCDEIYRTLIIASHEWSETVLQAPTCAENGTAQRICTDCGKEDGVVLSASHSWGATVVIFPSTCTEKGKGMHTCTVCQASEAFELELAGHTYVNGICTGCGQKFTESVTPYPEHPEYGMYFEIDDVISDYGPDYINEYGVLLDYNEGAKIEKVAVFLTQDGTMWRRCIACVGTDIEYATYVPYLSYYNDIKYTGLNSRWINIFPLKENSSGIWCYSNYTTIGVNLEDKYGNLLLSLYDIGEAGAKTKIFDDLDQMIAWLLLDCDEHVESDWITDDEPTCTEPGSHHKECTECGTILESEAIPSTGHNYNENGICGNCGEAALDYKPTIEYSEGLEFTSNGDGTCYVSGIGTCTDTDIKIPPVSPEGDSVTSIGGMAFYGCNITSMEIPDSVTSMGPCVFQNCTSLTSVLIGDGVTSIDYGIFSGCFSLTSIEVGKNNTVYKSMNGNLYTKDEKSLINYAIGKPDVSFGIPNTVTNIGIYAFTSCKNLTSVVIPNSVTSIGQSAFYLCTNLTSVVVPDSVTSIEGWAFAECTCLTSVFYTGNEVQWNNISIISTYNSYLTNATRYYYSETEPVAEGNFWHYVDGVPTAWPAYVAPETPTYSQGLEYTLSDDGTYYIVSGIGTCTDTDITIPQSYNNLPVQAIGDYAFEDCTSITSVIIPDGVTRIGSVGGGMARSFRNCANLTSIVIPDSVTYIGAAAGESAFFDCDKLWEFDNGIYYVNNWAISCHDGGISYSHKNQFESTILIIRDGTVGIANQAFICANYKEVVIPRSVKHICEVAFMSWANAERIYYSGTPSEWETIIIGSNNDGVTDTPVYYYSETEPTVEGNFWHYVDGVPTVWPAYVAPETPTYSQGLAFTSNGDGTCYVSGIGTCTDTDIKIPPVAPNGEAVIAIGYNAFSLNSSLTSVVIPYSVNNIGELAFWSCPNLINIEVDQGNANYTSIDGNLYTKDKTVIIRYAMGKEETTFVVPDGVTSIVKAFSVASVYFPDSKLVSIVIPDSVTIIDNEAFYGCVRLESIVIPCSVISIGEGAFGGCISLKNINVDENNEYYKSIDGNLYTKDGGILIQYSMGKTDAEFKIPSSVTRIGSYAFSRCYNNLTSIVIPSSVTSIGAYAFEFCSRLTDVYYTGTEGEWAAITIQSSNEPLTNATIHYNYVPEE